MAYPVQGDSASKFPNGYFSPSGQLIVPTPGTIYHNGAWVTPAQIQAEQTNASDLNAKLAYNTTANIASNKLATLLNDPNSIANSAAYKFSFDQGMEAVNRNAAAKGMLGSGNRLTDLVKFGQDNASQNYFNTVNSLGNFMNKQQMTAAQQDLLPGGGSYNGGRYTNLGGAY